MALTASDTQWVCEECMFTHANGRDENLLCDPEPLTKFAGLEIAMGVSEHEEWCPALSLTLRESGLFIHGECECNHITFSWSACHGCESTLGGERFAMVYFIEEV